MSTHMLPMPDEVAEAEAARQAALERRRQEEAAAAEARDRAILLAFYRFVTDYEAICTGWRYRADAPEFAGWLVVAGRVEPGSELWRFWLLDPRTWEIDYQKGPGSKRYFRRSEMADAIREWRERWQRPLERDPSHAAGTPLVAWLEEESNE